MTRSLALLPWLLAACSPVVPATPKRAEASLRYRDPIVLQRRELDETTGAIRLRGKLWVMEEDGSKLRQLTFGNTFDDHPTLYEDREHVFYIEYDDNRMFVDTAADNYDRTKGRLVKLDIYTGERTVVLDEPDCTYDHASLAIHDLPVYGAICGARPWRGKARLVHLGLGPSRQTPPFAKYIAQLAGQTPLVKSPWRGISKTDVSCVELGGHVAVTPDGKLFFECDFPDDPDYDVNSRAAIAYIDPKDNDHAKLFFDDGAFNHRVAASPDGQWVAWSSDPRKKHEGEGPPGDIFLASTDGSRLVKLPRLGGSGHPWFSRDSKSITVESDLSGQFEIWRVNLETKRYEQLTYGGARYQCDRSPK